MEFIHFDALDEDEDIYFNVEGKVSDHLLKASSNAPSADGALEDAFI